MLPTKLLILLNMMDRFHTISMKTAMGCVCAHTVLCAHVCACMCLLVLVCATVCGVKMLLSPKSKQSHRQWSRAKTLNHG
jgi:hypothetical protein